MLYENATVPVQHSLTKWEKFILRARQLGEGKATVLNVTLVIDRNGELECWTEPKCSRLESAPSSLGALIRSLINE